MKKAFSICRNALAIYGLFGIVFGFGWLGYLIYGKGKKEIFKSLDTPEYEDEPDVTVEKRGRKTYFCKKQSNNDEE